MTRSTSGLPVAESQSSEPVPAVRMSITATDRDEVERVEPLEPALQERAVPLLLGDESSVDQVPGNREEDIDTGLADSHDVDAGRLHGASSEPRRQPQWQVDEEHQRDRQAAKPVDGCVLDTPATRRSAPERGPGDRPGPTPRCSPQYQHPPKVPVGRSLRQSAPTIRADTARRPVPGSGARPAGTVVARTMPIERRDPTTQIRAILIAVVSLVFAVTLGYAVFRVATGQKAAVPAGSNSGRWNAGSAERLAREIERDGPILLSDVSGGGQRLPVYISHVGPDVDARWRAFEARPTDAPIDCFVTWKPKAQEFVAGCDRSTYPIDGTGLRQLPTTVTRSGDLIIDLTSPRPKP